MAGAGYRGGAAIQNMAESVESDLTSQPKECPIGVLLPAYSPRLGGVDDNHVRALAGTSEDFPPVLVQASSMRIVDGMHRVRAAELRGEGSIRVRLFEGDDSAAFVAAVEANVRHGLPLSLADREAAAARIVQLFPDWSNRAVAKVSGLSDKTVGVIRGRSTAEDPQLNRRLGQDGRVRPLDTSKARQRASELLMENPDASLRSVAHAVGLSPATVHDVRDRMRQAQDPIANHQRRLRGGQNSRRSRISNSNSAPMRGNRLSVLDNLKRDPSLRLNDAGKELLRWLNLSSNLPGDYEELVNGIPPHCIESVLSLALDCSSWWHTFAQQLENRRPGI